MKRFILVFILFLACFYSSTLVAQNTAPVPTTFTILDRGDEPSYRDLLKYPTNPVLRGDEVQLQAYSVEYGDAVDSVYYSSAAQVSMANFEGEIKYDVEVESIGYGFSDNDIGPQDSTVTIILRKRSYRLDSTATIVTWLNQPNRNVVDSLGWTFNNSVSVGDKFRVVLTYDYLMSADSDGRLLVNIISDALHEKQIGNSYTTGADSSLAGGDDSLEVFLLTPATGTFRVVWDVRATATCYFYIKTGITVSAGADTVTAVNDDYGSSNTTTAIFIKAPRSSNTGTYVQPMKIINSSLSAGGQARDIGERTLKNSTNYVFGVHSTAAAVVSVELKLIETD